MSPLAEGRELKLHGHVGKYDFALSPLAEGRELKFVHADYLSDLFRRPSRRGVN